MAGSLVELANRALTWLGERPLLSLDDSSVAAEIIRDAAPSIRRGLLSAHPWAFALRRVLLPALAQVPVFGYARAFELPADCLRIVQPNDQVDSYSIENGLLLTDMKAPLKFLYVADVEDSTAWHPLFDEAVTWAFAVQLAEPLTQKASKADMAMQRGEQVLRRARRTNAIQRYPVDLGSQSPWLDSRG